MISCIVLTKNESQDISKCLASLNWCDDVHVLDCGSTDNTVELAREHGAKVTVHVPDGTFRHADQRNWALSELSLIHDWVLFVDADEIVPPEFVEELTARLSNPGVHNSYYCAPKFIYHGRWLRHAKSFPTWEPRVILRGTTGFEPGGWERFDKSAISGYIDTPYEHYPNSKGLVSWVQKHAHYATWESGAATKHVASASRRIAARFGILRPFLVVAWFFFVRRGFLDGRPGLSYVRRMFIYELLVREAIEEERARQRGLPL